MKYCDKRLMTKEEADTAVINIQAYPNFKVDYPNGVRKYRCDLCDGWHLTGMKEGAFHKLKALKEDNRKRRIVNTARNWAKRLGVYKEDEDFDPNIINKKGEYNKHRHRK